MKKQNINLGILNKSDIPRLKMVYRTAPNFQTMPPGQLFEALDDKYENRGTFSVISYTLKKFFEETGDLKKSKFWGNIGADLSKIVNDEEMKNELTNNEKKNWRTQGEILEILNNMQIDNMTDYNRFLLLLMTTHQPPLRKSFYHNLEFLFDSRKNDGKNNYLLIQKTPLKAYYIVNEDKVSKYEKFNDDDSKYIEVDNKDLIKLLLSSYEKKPRTYIFEKENGTPYTLGSFSKVMLEEPYNLNFNILRSSYITAFYKDNQYTKERSDLARKMRHAMSRAEVNYLKRA